MSLQHTFDDMPNAARSVTWRVPAGSSLRFGMTNCACNDRCYARPLAPIKRSRARASSRM